MQPKFSKYMNDDGSPLNNKFKFLNNFYEHFKHNLPPQFQPLFSGVSHTPYSGALSHQSVEVTPDLTVIKNIQIKFNCWFSRSCNEKIKSKLLS